jgi:heme/copper-type cytochrome/quinol oxidase subunit 3
MANKKIKGQKQKIKRKSTQLNFKVIFVIFLLSLALFPSSIIIAIICMMPTILIILKDDKRYPLKWITVGGMNLAGALIPLTELWFSSNNIKMALHLLDPTLNMGTYLGSYLAAFLGIIVYNITPAICDFIIKIIIEKRIIELKLLEKNLKEEWLREDEAKEEEN